MKKLEPGRGVACGRRVGAGVAVAGAFVGVAVAGRGVPVGGTGVAVGSVVGSSVGSSSTASGEGVSSGDVWSMFRVGVVLAGSCAGSGTSRCWPTWMVASAPRSLYGDSTISAAVTPYLAAISLTVSALKAVWRMPVAFGMRRFWPGSMWSELTTSGLLL